MVFYSEVGQNVAPLLEKFSGKGGMSFCLSLHGPMQASEDTKVTFAGPIHSVSFLSLYHQQKNLALG
jgi:hypothetical protein